MSTQTFSELEWQALHEEIQKQFRALAAEVAPAAKPRYGKTATKLFPLFSHMSFTVAKAGRSSEIIVGVDVGPENGKWRIDADICDEEDGTIYFELPRTPFSVVNFDELKDRVLRTTEQLISGGKPVLAGLLNGAAPVMPTQSAAAPQVTQKA
jgi:hypothetical protein